MILAVMQLQTRPLVPWPEAQPSRVSLPQSQAPYSYRLFHLSSQDLLLVAVHWAVMRSRKKRRPESIFFRSA